MVVSRGVTRRHTYGVIAGNPPMRAFNPGGCYESCPLPLTASAAAADATAGGAGSAGAVW
jgi:hypothetical protein